MQPQPSFRNYSRLSLNKQFVNAPKMEEVLNEVCQIFKTTVDDLGGSCRKRDLVYARMIYSYVAQLLTKSSLREIGDLINRDHDVVVYYRDVFNDLTSTNDEKFLLKWNRYQELSVIWNKYGVTKNK